MALGHLFLLFHTNCPIMIFVQKVKLSFLRIQKAKKIDNSPCWEYQLHHHKGVCYKQVATYPMTACLGGANILRKQEIRY